MRARAACGRKVRGESRRKKEKRPPRGIEPLRRALSVRQAAWNMDSN